MGEFVARNTIKALGRAGRRLHGARVAVLGLSFKEDVRDIRNSRVPDIVAELAEFGARALVHDPLALPAEAQDHYGIELVGLDALHDLDAVVLAVPHAGLAELALELLRRGAPVFVDVKAKVPPERVPPGVTCWRL
jgi:UDP-N-acetyl-D-galactosamine dehydrogenase